MKIGFVMGYCEEENYIDLESLVDNDTDGAVGCMLDEMVKAERTMAEPFIPRMPPTL
jgi:hypothetical protein